MKWLEHWAAPLAGGVAIVVMVLAVLSILINQPSATHPSEPIYSVPPVQQIEPWNDPNRMVWL